MSLDFQFSAWVTYAADWLSTINDSTHGALDILIAVLVAGGALFAVYSYLHSSQ